MFANRGIYFAVILIRIRATLHLCDNYNGYLEIEKGKTSNTFTESGVSQNLLVQWKLKSPTSNNPTDIGECPGGSTVCSSQVAQTFTFSRTSNTISVIVNEPAAINKQIFWTMGLLLLTFSGSTKSDENSCLFDLINPPVGASCTVQFSGTTWAVTGLCNVTQVLSKRGRYYCRVYQANQPSSAQSLVGNFTMTTSKNGNTEYVDGYCQISLTLPPAGKYNYSIVIVPGETQVSPFFTGSNEIKLPQSPFHDCSQNITEGQTLKCFCNARELGNPPGFPVWNGTTSSELQLSNVSRTNDGMVYSCNVIWNNTVIEQQNYRLTVNYISRVVIFKIDNKEDTFLSVNENTSVSVECRADGRPMPSIRLIKRNSGIQDQQLAVSPNAQELHHTISGVTCEAAGRYVCQSENIIGTDEKDIQMIIFCAPRRAGNDSYSGTFEGNEAKIQFEMISYPAPDLQSIFYIGSSLIYPLSKQVELQNGARCECTSGNVYRYITTCTVTLDNKTAFTRGFYTAIFNNGLGSVSLTFEIKEGVDVKERSQPEVAGSVAGGVIGAVLFIVLVIGITIFVIRSKRKREERGPQMDAAFTSKTDQERSLEKTYDKLQSGDINSPSVYQALRHQQALSDSTHLEDQGKSHVYEVPIELHENTRPTHQKETIYQNNTFS